MLTELLLIAVCLGQVLETAAPAKTDSESVEVRYARAQVELAEANLSRVDEMNKRVAGSAPASVVDEYRDDLNVAKARLEQATAGEAGREFQVWLKRAKAEERTANAAWAIAKAVNVHLPGTFGSIDVERFRLRAEVARLQVERGSALVDAAPAAQLQWKVDLLDNQVQRLKEESRHRASSIRTYPYWPW